MKQTNSAIKFLLAHYRAILQSAHSKAFVSALTIASAMAAPQAMAQPTEINDWSGGLTADATIEVNGTDKLINISGGTVPNATGFTLNITGGNNSITGTATEKGVFTVTGGNSGSISVNGESASLAIGSASGKSGASVTVKTFSTDMGKVSIKADTEANASALVAETITIGMANKAESVATAADKGDAATKPSASITLGNFATLGSNTTALSIKDTGALVFAADATADKSQAITKDGIALDGGLIKVEDKGNGTISGGLTVTSGHVLIDGSTTASSLTVDGKTVFKGGSLTIAKQGTFKTIGTNDFEVDLSSASVKNSGTIDLGEITDTKKGTLKIANASFEDVFAGKVTAAGKGNQSKLALEVVGSGDITLDTLVNAKNGQINTDRLEITGSGTYSVVADQANVSYSGDTLSGSSYSFGSFTAGKAGSLTLDGANVSINNNLILTAAVKPETKAADAQAASPAINLINNGELSLAGNGATLAADILVGSSAKAASEGKFKITAGDWTVQTLNVQSGSASVQNGTLSVKGDLITTANGKIEASNGTVDASAVGTSDLAASAVSLTGSKFIIDQSDMFSISSDQIVYGNDKSKFDKTAISGDGASILQINNLSADVNSTIIKQLKKDLSQFSGFIEFGGSSSITSETGKKPWDQISGDAVIHGMYTDVTAQGDTFNAPASVGNIELSSATSATVGANSTLMLNNATANRENGKAQFITTKDGKTAGASLSGDSSKLVLISTGEIGSITTTSNSGSLSVGHVNGAGHVSVIGGVGDSGTGGALKNVTIMGDSSLSLYGETGGVYAQQLILEQGSKLNAKDHDVTVGKSGTESVIKGELTAKSLNFVESGTSAMITGDASVNLDTMSLASGSTVQIGDDTAKEHGSATVFTKSLTGEGTLFVDPDYNQKAAFFFAQSLADATSEQTAGTLKGKLIIGNNAAVGIGFNSEAEVMEVVRPYLIGDFAFSQSGTGFFDVGNALVLGKSITINKDQSINLKKGATSADVGSVDSVSLENGSAIIITDAAFNPDANGVKNNAAITFANSGTVNGSGGKIILSGDFDAEDNALTIFTNNSNNVTVKGTILVKSSNGLLEGEINSTNKGIVDLNVNETAIKTAFTSVSGPVADALKGAIYGKYKSGSGAGKKFLTKIANTSETGYEADAAAHAATYAGAQQAASAAVSTLATSVAARVGTAGIETSAIQATGSQANGGVWLSPMYTSVDADGFNAQGAKYGADIDFAGVTFGADTVNGNMRFGAVFSIGSGDADGKGNGAGLKNDFDYYGLGMYSAMSFGNFALVGDASLNVISNDIEGLGLSAKADTTAVTMGITGQYTISSSAVDVVPHLGARFTRLDTDSYDIRNEMGVIANTSFDVQNVFSVPLGLSLSKSLEMGGFSITPNADLSITFNCGDTEATSSTYFTGASTWDLNAEVMDEVTYSASLGLGAQYGAFGTTINLNYTGSENTDAFGVNASARYMF